MFKFILKSEMSYFYLNINSPRAYILKNNQCTLNENYSSTKNPLQLKNTTTLHDFRMLAEL